MWMPSSAAGPSRPARGSCDRGGMPRYRLTLEYDGAEFVGWQRQANGFSVQEALERAVTGFSGEESVMTGAGRTDSGVHALAQVAHFDLQREMAPQKLCDALNAHLKGLAVVVLDAERVSEDFHARFSATERRYLYRLLDRRSPPALERGRLWHVRHRLDADAMHRAAQSLLGRHDFTTYRSSHCQAESPVRTLDALDVARVADEVHVTARARSFLHNQVRSLVGTLKLVGEGKWAETQPRIALQAADRTRCGPVAPAHGLYLTGVGYGED